jgi:hypothetical protein
MKDKRYHLAWIVFLHVMAKIGSGVSEAIQRNDDQSIPAGRKLAFGGLDRIGEHNVIAVANERRRMPITRRGSTFD